MSRCSLAQRDGTHAGVIFAEEAAQHQGLHHRRREVRAVPCTAPRQSHLQREL